MHGATLQSSMYDPHITFDTTSTAPLTAVAHPYVFRSDAVASSDASALWTCAYGCGTTYRRSSGRSIRRHVVACFRRHWHGADTLTDAEVSALISREQDAGHIVTGLRRWKMRQTRRNADQIPPHERWTCSNAPCNKFYRSTSSRSIQRHIAACAHRNVEANETVSDTANADSGSGGDSGDEEAGRIRQSRATTAETTPSHTAPHSLASSAATTPQHGHALSVDTHMTTARTSEAQSSSSSASPPSSSPQTLTHAQARQVDDDMPILTATMAMAFRPRSLSTSTWPQTTTTTSVSTSAPLTPLAQSAAPPHYKRRKTNQSETQRNRVAPAQSMVTANTSFYQHALMTAPSPPINISRTPYTDVNNTEYYAPIVHSATANTNRTAPSSSSSSSSRGAYQPVSLMPTQTQAQTPLQSHALAAAPYYYYYAQVHNSVGATSATLSDQFAAAYPPANTFPSFSL